MVYAVAVGEVVVGGGVGVAGAVGGLVACFDGVGGGGGRY